MVTAARSQLELELMIPIGGDGAIQPMFVAEHTVQQIATCVQLVHAKYGRHAYPTPLQAKTMSYRITAALYLLAPELYLPGRTQRQIATQLGIRLGRFVGYLAELRPLVAALKGAGGVPNAVTGPSWPGCTPRFRETPNRRRVRRISTEVKSALVNSQVNSGASEIDQTESSFTHSHSHSLNRLI